MFSIILAIFGVFLEYFGDFMAFFGIFWNFLEFLAFKNILSIYKMKSQCDYCHKSFVRVDKHKCKRKQTLIDELQKEVNDKTEIILELQDEIKSLKTALRNAENEPRTTTINNITNNITLNVIDMKQIEKRLLKTVRNKTYKDLLGGLEPYLDMIATSLNPKNQMSYICTDHSRHVFAFKDDNGNIKKEYNGETVFQIEDKVKPVALQTLTDRYNYWKDTPEENNLIAEMEDLESRIEDILNHQKGHDPSSFEYERLSVRMSELTNKLSMKSRQLKGLRAKQINEDERDIEMERLMKARCEIRCVGKDYETNKKCVKYLSKHPNLNA